MKRIMCEGCTLPPPGCGNVYPNGCPIMARVFGVKRSEKLPRRLRGWMTLLKKRK